MRFFTNLLSSGNKNSKPAFEFLLPYVIVLTLGFIIADISTLYVRPYMLPNEAPPKKPNKKNFKSPESKSVYSAIASRNIFNSEGKIPSSLAQLAKKEKGENENNENEDNGPATLTRLPIKLLGTIVHGNPSKSIATLNLSNRNKTGSWTVDEDVESLIKILEVQRRKVIFRNLKNKKKEYAEIPEDNKLNFNSKKAQTPKPADKGNDIVKVRGDSRVIKRSDFLKQTSRMGELLRQASMVPNKGPDGSIQGFKFLSIKPGSIFEKLGFKVNDVIKGVNGEPVNSAAKGMELFNILKGDASSVNIDVNSGGRDSSLNYIIE